MPILIMFMRWSRSLGAQGRERGLAGQVQLAAAGRRPNCFSKHDNLIKPNGTPAGYACRRHEWVCNRGTCVVVVPVPDVSVQIRAGKKKYENEPCQQPPSPNINKTTNRPGMPWKLLEIAMRVGVEFQQGRSASDWLESRVGPHLRLQDPSVPWIPPMAAHKIAGESM
jgi:hypothetical protein